VVGSTLSVGAPVAVRAAPPTVNTQTAIPKPAAKPLVVNILHPVGDNVLSGIWTASTDGLFADGNDSDALLA
jgi:hypothetical protein